MAAILPGRTYDVTVFQPPGAPGEPMIVSLVPAAGTTGTVVTGVLKLAQRVLLELLTEQGSMLYEPTRGCELMSTLQGGGATSEVSIYQTFAIAANYIAQTLASDDPSGTAPLDEQLGSLELGSVVLSPGQVVLAITLTSAGGGVADVILPVATTP